MKPIKPKKDRTLNKNDTLLLRINKGVKESFKDKCDSNNTNPQKVLNTFIYGYINEDNKGSVLDEVRALPMTTIVDTRVNTAVDTRVHTAVDTRVNTSVDRPYYISLGKIKIENNQYYTYVGKGHPLCGWYIEEELLEHIDLLLSEGKEEQAIRVFNSNQDRVRKAE